MTVETVDDVIVRMLDERSCVVTPPTEADSDTVVGMKYFIMACLHRRMLDESFDDNMREWVESYTPEEFKEAVLEKTRKVKH